MEPSVGNSNAERQPIAQGGQSPRYNRKNKHDIPTWDMNVHLQK